MNFGFVGRGERYIGCEYMIGDIGRGVIDRCCKVEEQKLRKGA